MTERAQSIEQFSGAEVVKLKYELNADGEQRALKHRLAARIAYKEIAPLRLDEPDKMFIGWVAEHAACLAIELQAATQLPGAAWPDKIIGSPEYIAEQLAQLQVEDAEHARG